MEVRLKSTIPLCASNAFLDCEANNNDQPHKRTGNFLLTTNFSEHPSAANADGSLIPVT